MLLRVVLLEPSPLLVPVEVELVELESPAVFLPNGLLDPNFGKLRFWLTEPFPLPL